jgi:hypothetical protein
VTIEPPRLRFQFRRQDSATWLHSQLDGKAHVVEGREWTDPPEPPYDVVGLAWSLNFIEGLEARRALLRRATEQLKPGGRVVAIARACDSGIELVDWFKRSGWPPKSGNLLNKEIAQLRPSSGIFILNHAVYRRKEEDEVREQKFVDDVLKTPSPPKAWGALPDRFVVKIMDVGLIWQLV